MSEDLEQAAYLESLSPEAWEDVKRMQEFASRDATLAELQLDPTYASFLRAGYVPVGITHGDVGLTSDGFERIIDGINYGDIEGSRAQFTHAYRFGNPASGQELKAAKAVFAEVSTRPIETDAVLNCHRDFYKQKLSMASETPKRLLY